jgi:hypothetical protein
MKQLAKQYFGFLLGLVLGSVVATLTTYVFFAFYYGDIPKVNVEEFQEFQECLLDEE